MSTEGSSTPSPKIDPSSPYFLGPQDRLGDFITSTRLNSDNYDTWVADCCATAEAKSMNNNETTRNSMQTRKWLKKLTWFTINVIATSTGTENKQFHYDRKEYKMNYNHAHKLRWLSCDLSFNLWIIPPYANKEMYL